MVRLFAKVIPVIGFVFISLYASWAASEVVQYTYDDSGQLLRVEQGTDSIIDYSYDALSNRLTKTTSLSVTANNPPDIPVLLAPANAATEINSVGSSLEWTGGADPDSGNRVFYDVYFGESPQPPLYKGGLATKSLALTALPLRSLTTYYWKVVARDNLNAKSASQVWSFTTGNNIPSAPGEFSPRDNSYAAADSVYLAWSDATDADANDQVTYDVYFGTTAIPPLVASNIATTGYFAGTLVPETTYYWQVVARDNNHAVSAGPVISFKTLDPSHILSNVTLTTDRTIPGDGVPYLIRGNFTIKAGITLIVEPGAIIKLDAGANIIVNGTLLAQGTATMPIVFTSILDDYYGASLSESAFSPFASPGNWGRIQFNPTSLASVLAHCAIRFGGYAGFGNIYVNGASPSIISTIIEESSSYGVYISSGIPQLTNTRIVSSINSWLYIPADSVGPVNLSGSTFVGPNDEPGQITVEGGTINRDATWLDRGVAYHITGNLELYGTAGTDGVTTLTLSPGVKLKFDTGFLRVGYYSPAAALIAKGTADLPITLTSSKSTPAPGDWTGLQFHGNTKPTSALEYCTVEYGGAGGAGNIYINGPSLPMQNMTIRKSSNYGVYIAAGSPVIKDASITDNGTSAGHYGMYVGSGSPQVTNTGIVSSWNSWLYIPADSVGPANLTGSTFVDSAGAPGHITVASGRIGRDATWLNRGVAYHITGNLELYGTDGTDAVTTLTLSPGVKLRFDTGFLRVGYYSPAAALIAKGTADLPITLTSSKSTPAPGDWTGLQFHGNTKPTSALEYCTVEYGGAGGAGNIYINGPALPILNTTVRKSSNHGIYVASGSPVIKDSHIVDNGTTAGHYAVYFASGSPQLTNTRLVSAVNTWLYIPADSLGPANLTGSTFVDPNNAPGYITVEAGRIGRDATWLNLDIQYYRITGNLELYGTDGTDAVTTLTLSPGVKLRFDTGFLRVGYYSPAAALIAKGTADLPITLTSSKSTPAPGDWTGLQFHGNTKPTSALEYCTVEYGGAGGAGNIYINGLALPILNTTVRKSSNHGIYVASGKPTIQAGRIIDNISYGIYNAGTSVISANNVWWGHMTGPYDPSNDAAKGGWYNPNGQGNKVTDRVAYWPWDAGSADTDEDGLSDHDELFIYGTDPLKADTDGDGIKDGDEVTFWGANWNADADGDGIINLLDSDSDNDGYSDGVEKKQGTDPADDTSFPAEIVYEDAEDGLTLGWHISDAEPAGALVSNVFDAARSSSVIQLAGDALNDSYRLYDEEGAEWNNTTHQVLSWSMKYSEDFVVTILVQTSGGPRLLTYTPEDVSNLGEGSEIHHGLGIAAKDGTWQTFTVDLQYDLQEAQPGNQIQSVLGFTISGSGMVDDIKTMQQLPPSLDSDEDGLTDSEEIYTYGTHPYIPDTDADTLADGDELTYWGTAWNSDPDGDLLVNLFDPDADGDGFMDGIELTQGTDPADVASFPVQ